MTPDAGELSRDAPADAVEQVVLEAKYAGYIDRQAEQVERFQRLESRPIPAHFDYAAVPQLRAEAKEKLSRVRPASLGQAGRISGISPADLAVLMIYLGEWFPSAGPSRVSWTICSHRGRVHLTCYSPLSNNAQSPLSGASGGCPVRAFRGGDCLEVAARGLNHWARYFPRSSFTVTLPPRGR